MNKNVHHTILKTVFITVLFALNLSASGQKYEIAFHLKNLPDSVCYLAQYRGENILLQDTAMVEKGKAVFKGDTTLTQGMYVLAGESNNKILDFLVDDQQQFSASLDMEKPVAKNITFKNSPENKLFYKYVSFLNQKQKRMQKLQQQLKAEDGNKDALRNKMRKINREVETFQSEFSENNEGTFAAAFVKASRQITVPDSITDKRKQYEYYKTNFWDNIPLDDDRMLHTPFFHDRWETYMDKVVRQHPDSLIAAVDFLLEKAPDDSEMFKYLLWESTQKYEQSKIMGFDAVFTHIALNYFKKGRTSDINDQVVENIIERGETLKNLLLGKTAPNLVMQDTNRKPHQLHEVDANYTVVAFWDSECGHCKEVIPKLAEFYNENAEKYNLEVFAVSTDTSISKWKDFINKHQLNWTNVNGYWSYTKDFHDLYDINSTPVIYLLDKDKAIIGKRISVPQIEEVIQNKQGMK